ncbi:MAG: imidazolonepropionase [Candidatus Dormibacteraeota bacterium]|nr:imidazolonepropionase [Candidatus Dormibacteraeota bacterium]
MTTLVVRGIGRLCTCDPARDDPPGVLEKAALVVRDGFIAFAGGERELAGADLPDDAETLDVAGAAVIPGFVDSHTHLIWLGDRSDEYARRAAGESYESIAESGGGIRATVAATAAGDIDTLVAAAFPRARRMLRLGTTTVEVKSGYGVFPDAELRQLDAANALGAAGHVPDVVTTYLPLHSAPPGDRNAYVDEVVATGVREAATRAYFTDVHCEQGAFTVEECERVLVAARAHGMGMKVHADQLSRCGGARLAARLGAVSADHLEMAGDTDLLALAGAGVVATLLPGASLVLGGPPPPGRRALDCGCVVAIATDCNPGTSYSESMPLMCSLAVAEAGLTPAEALVAATAGGAAALGLDDRGVLRRGARADFLVLDSDRWIDVAYHLGGNVVARVFKGGRDVLG